MTAVPSTLDHLVWAVPDLAAGIDAFEALTGVRATPGGSHPTGTANALVALTVGGARGDTYLEIIGPDPLQNAPRDQMQHGVADVTEPTLTTFAVHTTDIAAAVAAARAAGYDPGDPMPQSRTRPDGTALAWQLTTGARADGPTCPFLIDWGDTVHPARDLEPAVELVSLTAEHPHPESVAKRLGALGVEMPVVEGESPRLVATLGGAIVL